VKKKHKALIILLSIIIGFLLILGCVPSIRSHALMALVTKYEEANVVGKDEGIHIDFSSPSDGKASGLDWFSQMILFNKLDMPIGRLGFEGEETLDLSIYYTFGDFEKGSSLIYNLDSPYNSAFYGAYVIRLNTSKDLKAPKVPVDLMKLTDAITRYDYRILILYQLGLNIDDALFAADVTGIQKGVTSFGSDDWLKVDAEIKTRSVTHTPKTFQQHYLQFGRPLENQASGDFPEVTLYGRTYSRFFPEENVYIIFYIQAASADLVEMTDKQLLSKSRVFNKW
jgi:hypothetical protein